MFDMLIQISEKFLQCTIDIICNNLIYIIIYYLYIQLHPSHPREARRNMKLYYVYHTTSYCVHISLHLFSFAQSAEIKCYVLRTTYKILIHVVYHKNIICVAYTGKHNLPIRAERGEKFIVYHHSRSKNHSRSINSFPPARRISVQIKSDLRAPAISVQIKSDLRASAISVQIQSDPGFAEE